MNPKMRHVPGQIAGPEGVLLPTTDHMASSHVPLADQYPRRGAGRKGAYRRRHAMAQAPPLPPSPRRAQRPGQGNGTRAGSGLDTFRSLNTPRQHDTTTDNEHLRLRKTRVIGAIHEQPLLRPENPWIPGSAPRRPACHCGLSSDARYVSDQPPLVLDHPTP